MTVKKLLAVAMIVSHIVAINPAAYALPAGENVVAGSASFDRSVANQLTINQATDKLITDWQNFSNDATETIEFLQPSTGSIALNRVIGGDPSTIFGALKANGKVFILNQNGILFGQGAQVNTNGLVASSLDVNNEQFMSGQYQYVNPIGQPQTQNGYIFVDPGAGIVINQADLNIPGGYVALIGGQVENAGSIVAGQGIVMASGDEVRLNLDPQGYISAVISKNLSATLASAAIKNTGNLETSGAVTITAKTLNNVFDDVINTSGIVTAKSISISSNGDVSLSGYLNSNSNLNVSGNDVNINEANVMAIASGADGSTASININANKDVTVNNSNLVAFSRTTPQHSSVSSSVSVTGHGAVALNNSSVRANVENAAVADPQFINSARVSIRSTSNEQGDVSVSLNNTRVESIVDGAASFSEHTIEAVHNNVTANDALTAGSASVEITNGSSIEMRQDGIGSEKLTIRATDKSLTSDAGTANVSIDNSTITVQSAGAASTTIESIDQRYQPVTVNAGDGEVVTGPRVGPPFIADNGQLPTIDANSGELASAGRVTSASNDGEILPVNVTKSVSPTVGAPFIPDNGDLPTYNADPTVNPGVEGPFQPGPVELVSTSGAVNVTSSTMNQSATGPSQTTVLSGNDINMAGSSLTTKEATLRSDNGNVNAGTINSQTARIEGGNIDATLLNSNDVVLIAKGAVGSEATPLTTNSDTVSARAQGDINIRDIGDVALGQPNENSVTSHGGRVIVDAAGDMVVHTVRANDGVRLTSENGSIYAGFSNDGVNVRAGGPSYVSSANGTIGVGSPGTEVPGVSGQVQGTIENGSPVLDLANGVPFGTVYYDNTADTEAPQAIWPLPGTATSLNNPLTVAITNREGSVSAIPANVATAGDLVLRIGQPAPIPTNPENPGNINGNLALVTSTPLTNNGRAYFEILEGTRFRFVERVTPTGFYAYHPLTRPDTSSIDNFQLDEEAYEFIDGKVEEKKK